MSIEPFFRDEPQLRDDLADTRKEVVTICHDDDLYGVDTPPTYAMGLAEQLAALHADARASTVDIMLRSDGAEGPFEQTTVTLEDLDLAEPLEDFDPDALLDRQTLPSAPYPAAILDDGATTLPWDVLPAAVPSFPDSGDLPPESPSDAAPSSRAPVSSSLWGKIQKFVNGISRPRSQPPVSSSTSRRISQRTIFELVWTLDNAALDALNAHIEHIIAVRRLGPEAYAESRIVDMLDIMHATERGAPDGIGISFLRARIPEVSRMMFDRALLRLEHRGIIALLPDEPGQDGIVDHARGHLNRCILLQPAV